MKKQQSKTMESFIDKLCDHLPSDRIQTLIDNGFDEWETITYLKGQQLIDLGFDTQECIIIMVAANSNAIQHEQTQIFTQQKMQQVIANAKQRDQDRQQKILKEQQQNKINKQKTTPQSQKSINSVPSSHQIKQHPLKQISQALISKGTFSKAKPGQKVNLAKITVIALQDKQITNITNLQKCPNLVNLHLGNNYINRIEGLTQITKLKDLKLEHNNITKIEGLECLVNLQHLNLSSNYIARLQNLDNNKKLHELFISKQKINCNFTFNEQTMANLAYTLQKLQCSQNKIKSINELKNLAVVRQVNLSKNQLQDVGELSQTINGMQNLKNLSFKDNPLTKSQKYRDYIVILSKTLQQLDGKKILAKQRQYLVKLYALKHAKQQNTGKTKTQTKPPMNLQGVKMQEEYGQYNANINRATDLRGNMPFANTKHVQR